MLKEYAKVFKIGVIFLDAFVVVFAFLMSFVLTFFLIGIIPPLELILILPVLVFFWAFSLNHFSMYRSFRMREISTNLSIVLRAGLLSFVVFCLVAYVFQLQDIGRAFIFIDFFITALLLFVEKTFFVLLFQQTRKKGYNYREVLIVGTGKRAERFIQEVLDHREWGLRIAGVFDREGDMVGKEVVGQKVLGTFKDIPDVIQNNVVDEVVFVVPRSWLTSIEEVLHYLEIQGVKVSVAVDYFDLKLSTAKQTDLHGIPLITFESAPDKVWHLVLKRLLDIVGSFFGLLCLLPLFAVVAVLIKLSSKGPIFFSQKRSSLNGRVFPLYKFRTMVPDAESKLKDLMEHNEMEGPVFKMENDPRVTCLGRVLRKLSIDELPQLWNVLKGDMSLVGPRPPIPDEVQQYEPWQRRRLSMRPGITCLWQVMGRNTITDFDEWMRLDLEYIDNWSLWLDVKLLFLTVPAVLFGSGAK